MSSENISWPLHKVGGGRLRSEKLSKMDTFSIPRSGLSLEGGIDKGRLCGDKSQESLSEPTTCAPRVLAARSKLAEPQKGSRTRYFGETCARCAIKKALSGVMVVALIKGRAPKDIVQAVCVIFCVEGLGLTRRRR